MSIYLAGGGVLAAAIVALFFSTISFALRDFSRVKLTHALQKLGKSDRLQPTLDYARDLIFVTSVARLFSNILVLIFTLAMIQDTHFGILWQYVLGIIIAGIVTLLSSVAIPLAAARYAGETLIAFFIEPLHALRIVLMPVTKISHGIDALFRQASGKPESDSQLLEDEILSVVEEGEKEGIVDVQEREMIESVIQFRDTTAGQIMTPRPEMVAIELPASLEIIKQTIQATGHSRIPVYERTLDHVVGILYARDLLRYIGQGPATPEQFDLRKVVRPALFVPETKPLRDLLQDFRLQNVHISIVLDEYGGTTGLVTIEDILEELVGDISDEHERSEPAMLHKINDQSWDADARVYIDELNRTLGVSLPEDAGFDTLGGFVTTTLGRIPTTGTTFEHAGVKYTVLGAEPQKVNRVRIDLAMAAVNDPSVSLSA
jgi:CBS domain containing-hemolysin-like protein